MPLSQVRDLLGDASIVTTERYDNQQMERLQVARASWNRASSSGTDAGSGTEFHISFTTRPPGETAAPVTTIEDARKLLRSQQVEDWLGVRDAFWNWLVSAA